MPNEVIAEKWVGRIPAEEGEEIGEFLDGLRKDEDFAEQGGEIGVVAREETVPMILRFGKKEKDLGIHTFKPSTKPDVIHVNPKTKLVWVAYYVDGTIFSQYSEDGTEHSVEEVSREGLRGFSLATTMSGRILFHQDLQPGMRFFYRRRNALQQGVGSDEAPSVKIVHIVGCEYGHGVLAWPVRHNTFIYEDDFRILSGDFVRGNVAQAGFEQWRHPIKSVPVDLEVIT
jgi:hypothetical protein